MKKLLTTLFFLIYASAAYAITLECKIVKSETKILSRAPSRLTPYISVNFGGKIIPLGQELFPSFEGCQFFCLGQDIYVYRGETFLGIIEKNFAFRCADKVLVGQLIPKPESCYAADTGEVKYICSRVYFDRK